MAVVFVWRIRDKIQAGSSMFQSRPLTVIPYVQQRLRLWRGQYECISIFVSIFSHRTLKQNNTHRSVNEYKMN